MGASSRRSSLPERGAPLGGAPVRAWGGFASFGGVVFGVDLEPAHVERMLPPPLVRVDGPTHGPALVIFAGEMSAGGAYLGGIEFPSGMRYREVGIVVPSVSHPFEDQPVAFAYRMYADHELPVALGNRFYGLGKLPRAVVWNGPNIAVSDTDGVRFSCGGGLRGEWSRRPEASKALLDLARIFEGPVVGRRGPGDFVKVFFDWSFEGAEVSEFVGEGILHLEETDELVPFRVHEGRGFAVRGMGFRTCPPERVTARDVKHGPGPR